MLISYNWLNEFIPIPNSLTPKDVAADLKMRTVEVEEVRSSADDLENIVVGRIVSVEKHPNADSLKLCRVYVGKGVGNKELQIVCGGSNLRENMMVAVGKIGARVRWHGQGEPVELKKVKIRDIESNGMICASDEIGLGEIFPDKSVESTDEIPTKVGKKEILDLSSLDVRAGASLAEALGLDDTVFDIDNKSMTNRPDLWSHYGIARELSVFYNKNLKLFNPPKIKEGKEVKLSVEVEDKELCPRYMSVVLSGIKILPSPAWLQKRLLAIGVRPINNVVDITNYIMYEIGQPMHAFDAKAVDPKSSSDKKETLADKLLGQEIIVARRAESGEKFTTLDGREHILSKDMLVIADKNKAIALAGVMGGENSVIRDDTRTIIFEAANFNATSIRKTSIKLGLRTDSSTRFEKSLDPRNVELALRRAVELTLKVIPSARVISNVVDKAYFKISEKPIKVSLEMINKKLGINVGKKDVTHILKKLGFEVSFKSSYFLVSAPSWRAAKDVTIAEDVVEEVARMYGYENIVSTLPVFAITPSPQNKLKKVERKLKEALAFEFGFSEVCNYPFVSQEWLQKMGEGDNKYIELDNPVAKDRPLVRRHLLPNMLVNVEENLHRYDMVKIFEIGKTYILEEAGMPVSAKALPGKQALGKTENSSLLAIAQRAKASEEYLPKQDTILGMVYSQKGVKVPFWELSESVFGALHRLGLSVMLKKTEVPKKSFAHGGRYADIYINDTSVGFISELNPIIEERLGIPYRTAILELKVDMLVPLLQDVSAYASLPEFPSVDRDLAFVVDKKVEHAQIAEMLKNVDNLIVKVELFDAYEGKPILEGKKSVAYHIVYRSPNKTLESKEVDVAHEKIIKVLEKKFGAEMRK